MGTIARFEEIEAWKNARKLTRLIYEYSSRSDFSRDFALQNQIRRSTVSIMSNIAEGFESHTQPLFIKYLGHSKASTGETRSQLYIAYDLGYITEKEFKLTYELTNIINSQIYKFVQYLKTLPVKERM